MASRILQTRFEPDIEIASEIERYIELVQRSDLDEEEERLKDNISEFITQGFIDDIGNFLLLRDTDNIGASNRPLAEKMTQYYPRSTVSRVSTPIGISRPNMATSIANLSTNSVSSTMVVTFRKWTPM